MNEGTEDNIFHNDPVKCVYMLVLGIVTWCIFGVAYYNEGGMDNFQNIILDIMLVLAMVITIFIIYLVLPLEIIADDKYVFYHKRYFKEKRVYWHNYNSTQKVFEESVSMELVSGKHQDYEKDYIFAMILKRLRVTQMKMMVADGPIQVVVPKPNMAGWSSNVLVGFFVIECGCQNCANMVE